MTAPDLPEDPAQKNAAAIMLLDEWYATPDDRLPGYWDELVKERETNRLRFRAQHPPQEGIVNELALFAGAGGSILAGALLGW
jgi:hypothetical protein